MGADLLLSWAPAPITTNGFFNVEQDILDGTVAHRVWALSDDEVDEIKEIVDGMSFSQYQEDEPGPRGMVPIDELRTEFRQGIIAAAREVTGFRRDVSHLLIDEKGYLFTGGMSWGDDPTDAFRPMQLVQQAGIFDKPFGVGGKRWLVSDQKHVEVGERCFTLGTFDTEQEGSEFIATLPEYESGRYGLDDLGESGVRITEGNCSHCSKPVVWNEGSGRYFGLDPKAPDYMFCGPTGNYGDYHQITRD